MLIFIRHPRTKSNWYLEKKKEKADGSESIWTGRIERSLAPRFEILMSAIEAVFLLLNKSNQSMIDVRRR